jgi:excisionase family DNA binding protein
MRDAPTKPPAASAPRLLLKPQEAANALGISLRTLMAMRAADEIPYVELGARNLRFPVDALRDWLARRTAWPTEIVSDGAELTANSPGIAGTKGSGAAKTAASRQHGGNGK